MLLPRCAAMPIPMLAALTVCSAALAILGGLGVQPWLLYAFKPLTTLLIIAHAWPRGIGEPPRRWVLLGLLFSLAGDVALMWPERGFVFGLLAFLLAHLCYLWAFTRVERFAAWPWSLLFYALLAGGILARLWPGVPAELRPPVIAYVLCLAAMAAQTAVLWRRRGAAVLALGGLLFVVSDALLATNKFASGPLPLASLWVLLTYWAAQWCIASWLAPARPARP